MSAQATAFPKSLVDKGRVTTKILHYTLRGSIPVLLDNDVDDQCNEHLHPHKRATLSVICKLSSSLQTVVRALCHELSIFVSSLVLTPLGSDTKIVREVCQSFIIICTRRSAQSLAVFQSLSLSRALEKSQLHNPVLKAQVKHQQSHNGNDHLYKNGEEGGKTLPGNSLSRNSGCIIKLCRTNPATRYCAD